MLPDTSLPESLVLGADHAWVFGRSEGTTLFRWDAFDEPPTPIFEVEEDFFTTLVPVGEVAWGIRYDGSREATRSFFRLDADVDLESPELVVPYGGMGFEVFQAGSNQRAFVRVDDDVYQLTRDDVVRVEGMPPDLLSITPTPWGAYAVVDPIDRGREPHRIVRPELGEATEPLDLAPGPSSSHPSSFTPAFDGYVFLADDGVHGRELWFDDGESARMVCDFIPGLESGAEPSGLLADEEGVYLRFDTGDRGLALWRVHRDVVEGNLPCPRLDVQPSGSTDGSSSLGAADDGCRCVRAPDGRESSQPLGALAIGLFSLCLSRRQRGPGDQTTSHP